MHYYKAKLAMITLLLLLFQPIPTPTPSLVQAEDDLAKSAQTMQAFTTALATFTPLMVLALGLFTALAGIVIFGRRQNNIQPLLNSQQKLLDALLEQKNDTDDKHQQALEALAIAQEQGKTRDIEIKAIVTSLNAHTVQLGTLFERVMTNFERQTGIIEVMATKGSQPVQDMSKLLTSIASEGSTPMRRLIISVSEIKETVDRIEKKLVECAEMKAVVEDTPQAVEAIETISTDVQVADKLLDEKVAEKRKTDSRPIVRVETKVESDAA